MHLMNALIQSIFLNRVRTYLLVRSMYFLQSSYLVRDVFSYMEMSSRVTIDFGTFLFFLVQIDFFNQISSIPGILFSL